MQDGTTLYGVQIMSLDGSLQLSDEESYGYSTHVLVKTSDATTSVPEPPTLLLFGVGMVGLGALQLRKKV